MVSLNEAERVLEMLRSGWKEMEMKQAAAQVSTARASMDAGMAVQA